MTDYEELLQQDRRYVWHPYASALDAPAPVPVTNQVYAVLSKAHG